MTSRDPFAPLPANINKYTRGKLILVVGSASYTGAAVLAARAAERMGAGYTEVVTVPEAMDIVRSSSPSLVVRDRTTWQVSSVANCVPNHPIAVGIGSGFEGTSEENALVATVLQEATCPVLVDGKALDFVGSADIRALLHERSVNQFPTVLTPHGGEAARLADALGLRLSGDNPAQDAQTLAKACEALVVLKGPDTYISDGTTTTAMTLGTPALAKAGTGDVLAGMISSLLAQGVAPFVAAQMSATVHALAGREATRVLTETSVIAGDLVQFIPMVITKMQAEN